MDLAIARTDSAALRSRCETTGVRIAADEPGYEPGAVLPAGPWRPLTAEQAARLAPAARTAGRTLVELVRFPADRLRARPNTLADPLGDPDAVHLGLVASPAGALTTTPDYRNGRRIGLHVDNWDHLDYAAKDTGRRRLCVNLGPGARYLLLGDLDIRTVCRTLYPDPAGRHPHTADLRAYAAERRPLTCLRIRLDPGEGYLAPTELLPHDGSTHRLPEPSTAAFWLGRWPRGTLPSAV